MKLSLLERLLIPVILPQQGGIVELRVAQKAIEVLALTGGEIDCWAVEDVPGGGVKWDSESDTEKEIDLPVGACDLIRKVLVAKEEARELPREQLTLYEKFVEGTPPEE